MMTMMVLKAFKKIKKSVIKEQMPPILKKTGWLLCVSERPEQKEAKLY